ncbi:MAG: hypothetical protein E7262_08815 [Lachnospiraceae bacterium]|nr:hypothetical protein [Lachnospiraceae bacterium]
MVSEAILSSCDDYTSFMYDDYNIRFKTSSKLEKYTEILEWDNGYLVVMAKYEGIGIIEDYIDLLPILENLYLDVEKFLKPIEKVRISYDRYQ